MILTLANVLFVLVAVAMIVLILLQRGAGAAAGSGFGAGASATVFGARGASNFLSKSTAILAGLFFVISLGMAVYLHKTAGSAGAAQDLGIMGSLPAASEVPAGDVPAAAPAAAVPAEIPAAAPAADDAAPAADTAAPATDVPVEQDAPAVEDDAQK